jgi:hypothetical protein
MTPDPPIREPEQIRLDVSRKVRAVRVSDQFTAILACLVGERAWTNPALAELVLTSDGMLLGRCEGEPEFRAFLGNTDICSGISTVWPRSRNWMATSWGISSPGSPRSNGSGERSRGEDHLPE